MELLLDLHFVVYLSLITRFSMVDRVESNPFCLNIKSIFASHERYCKVLIRTTIMSQWFPTRQAGQRVTPEPKHAPRALALRGHLFGTFCINPRHPNKDCLHGALPREATYRAQVRDLLVAYFTERMQDEELNAPIGFTNMQFYLRHEQSINQDMINLLYADAVNAILNRNQGSGYNKNRLLFRLAMYFEEWKKRGSEDSRAKTK